MSYSKDKFGVVLQGGPPTWKLTAVMFTVVEERVRAITYQHGVNTSVRCKTHILLLLLLMLHLYVLS